MGHDRDGIDSARRSFLRRASAATLASVAGREAVASEAEVPPASGPLPAIRIGRHSLSRLIVGCNPIHGYSYLGPHTDRHMREYFTAERTVEFLQQCETEGINTFQFSPRDYLFERLVELRRRGSKMQLVCLHSDRRKIPQILEQTEPIALVHHGAVTDKLFSQNRGNEVHDYVKAARDAGVLAGVSAHNPDNIRRIADAGWPVDLFMTCFYCVSRSYLAEHQAEVAALPTLQIAYPFFKDDPDVMTEVIRQVEQPCLAFKILAAGRQCRSQETVRSAFRYALQHIKPGDGIIVGMYPRFYDEIAANVRYTCEFG